MLSWLAVSSKSTASLPLWICSSTKSSTVRSCSLLRPSSSCSPCRTWPLLCSSTCSFRIVFAKALRSLRSAWNWLSRRRLSRSSCERASSDCRSWSRSCMHMLVWLRSCCEAMSAPLRCRAALSALSSPTRAVRRRTSASRCAVRALGAGESRLREVWWSLALLGLREMSDTEGQGALSSGPACTLAGLSGESATTGESASRSSSVVLEFCFW
mmetsp:Transcript_23241/g.31828  ORF Transcript_23241/g.31828 Transcript_23241/m.31828 type:complete len:213 (+) Transcript_23241:98-736(+)